MIFKWCWTGVEKWKLFEKRWTMFGRKSCVLTLEILFRIVSNFFNCFYLLHRGAAEIQFTSLQYLLLLDRLKPWLIADLNNRKLSLRPRWSVRLQASISIIISISAGELMGDSNLTAEGGVSAQFATHIWLVLGLMCASWFGIVMLHSAQILAISLYSSDAFHTVGPQFDSVRFDFWCHSSQSYQFGSSIARIDWRFMPVLVHAGSSSHWFTVPLTGLAGSQFMAVHE